MGRAAFVIVAAALVSGVTGVRSQPAEPFHVEDPSRWGQPTHVVLPDYPKEALEKHLTGYVDFEGVVGPLRDMTAAEFTADSPGSEPFVAAVKQVLPYWGFYPSFGSDCMPAPVPVRTRVWFDLDGDKPKTSVTRRPGGAKAVVHPTTTPTYRRDPEYPYSAMREGLQAYVYSRMEVDEAGKVVAVASEAYPRDANREQFARSSERAFLRWEFPPGPKRTVCMEVVFRVRN